MQHNDYITVDEKTDSLWLLAIMILYEASLLLAEHWKNVTNALTDRCTTQPCIQLVEKKAW